MKVPIYKTAECIKLIKKKYPYIPIWIISRVLYANDLYMHSLGVIDFEPKLEHWTIK